MAAVVWEIAQQQIDAGGGQFPKATATAVVTHALTSEQAYAAVKLAAGAYLLGLPLYSIQLQEKGGNAWVATVQYQAGPRAAVGAGGSPPAAPTGTNPLGPEWSFDTGGGSQKITQSLATREGVNATGPMLIATGSGRYDRAIGVTKEGVEGTDIASRKLEFTLSVRSFYLTQDYVTTLYRLTGTVNKDPFLDYEAGEVLLLGATGQSQTPSDGETPAWTLGYKFAASPNRVKATIDPLTTLPVTQVAKNLEPFLKIGGWDYVWVSYAQKTDSGRTVLVPETAWVEKVYPDGDFSLLGLFS